MAINPQKTQAILNEKTSIQTDIFSLGATLYRFLTGKLPNSAFNRALSVWLGNDDPLLPPSVLNQNLPSEIDGVILRSMSILPSNRTVSVTEFKNTLQKVTKSGSVLLPQTEELQPDNKKGRSSSLPRFSNRHFDSYLNEIFQLRAKILQQEEELFKLKKYQQPQLINLRSIPNRVYSE
jgi:serine/threonine protein kinase